ncbi:Response regulator of zinc sigma-54-dependent two-component system [hydrothermal vent metagenome]|uniref:Response regulator of zinc sigma-54-dependent two-component system n=1 Tax=hydrothermal vent metagenome TaxID=652676 RepID=A0A3B1D984_9ZZZZ
MTDNSQYKILVVDDEPLIRESLYEILRIEGYHVQMAASGEDAYTLIEKDCFDIVVTDLKLPIMTGLDLLIKTKKSHPNIEFILITGYGSIETAVEAMRKNAFDYITKPINDDEIKIIIQKILEKKAILNENAALKEIIAQCGGDRATFGNIIGGSQKMQSIYNIVDSVASSNATILITGESGTGKGLLAKSIHEHDQQRNNKPFIEISCGAISETLLESELFGHVKGAFTGAIKDKEGRFEYAKGGTIFLDEIDSFSLGLQVKLLRVLQDGVFERVGDNITRKAEARILVATNQDLPDLILEGKFREDLYYRINVIAIQMPSLRERKEDIETIAQSFIKKYNTINKKNIQKISNDVKKIFQDYHWPGNIRELENAIEGAVIMAKTEIIHKENIPNLAKFISTEIKPLLGADGLSLKKIVEQPERDHIVSVLNDCRWNRNKAAAVLGVNRTTLYNKMKKYHISEDNH